MKKLLIILLGVPFLSLAQVGINTTTPEAMLDIVSEYDGALIPRLDDTTISAMTAVEGMLVFSTTQNCLMLNIGSSSADWRCVSMVSKDLTSRNANSSKELVELPFLVRQNKEMELIFENKKEE